MPESGYGSGREPLTPLERRRLRATVDPAALERWLVATHGEFRRAVIAHFATEITADDLLAVRREAGDAGAIDLPLSDGDEAELADARPVVDAPLEGLRFRFVSTWQPIVMVEPPSDPELRVLWDAIEPEIDAV
jgi:hypothetical protein